MALSACENVDGCCHYSVTSGFRHYASQKQNAQVTWRLPDDATVAAPTRPGEPIVGGVYLRLFVANPGWVVRRPKEFLAELMDTCLALMNKEKLDVSNGTHCWSTKCCYVTLRGTVITVCITCFNSNP